MSAVFNLGLTLQQMSHWTDAIESYRQVNAAAAAFPDSVKPQMRLESQIRECDLLQGLQLTAQALVCWELGIDQFPTDGVIHNEIGTIYAKVCFRFCFNVLLIFFFSGRRRGTGCCSFLRRDGTGSFSSAPEFGTNTGDTGHGRGGSLSTAECLGSGFPA
jgi:hypothetical protein